MGPANDTDFEENSCSAPQSSHKSALIFSDSSYSKWSCGSNWYINPCKNIHSPFVSISILICLWIRWISHFECEIISSNDVLNLGSWLSFWVGGWLVAGNPEITEGGTLQSSNVNFNWVFLLPKRNSEFALEKRPKPKRKTWVPTMMFSGAFAVSFYHFRDDFFQNILMSCPILVCVRSSITSYTPWN